MDDRTNKLSLKTSLVRLFFNHEDELLQPIPLERLKYLIDTEDCNPLFNKKGFNALHAATLPETPDKMKRFEFLLERGLNINSIDGSNLYHNTVLHHLIVNEDEQTAIDLIKLCIEKKHIIDFNLFDVNEVSVFCMAVKCRLVNLALFLTTKCEEFKIDINRSDKDGNTPLHYAYALGMPGLVERLIKAGADTEVENKNRQPPIQMLECTQEEIRTFLLSVSIHPDRDKVATRNHFVDHQGNASFICVSKKKVITKRILHTKSELPTLKFILMFGTVLDQNQYRQGSRLKLTGKQKASIYEKTKTSGVSLVDHIMSINENTYDCHLEHGSLSCHPQRTAQSCHPQRQSRVEDLIKK